MKQVCRKNILFLSVAGMFVILFFSSNFDYIYTPAINPITPGPSHIIKLWKDGFYPTEIIVEKGSTVTFQTTLKRNFWPASNFHPTHTVYSEFDPKEPIPSDSSWNFTFDKVGIWTYHDHLFPQYTGKITVIDSQKGIKNERNIIRSCNSEDNTEKESTHCFVERMLFIARNQGISASFEILSKEFDGGSYFHKTACHYLTHYLGEMAYNYFKSDKTIEPDARFNYCGTGFYHGFVEAMFLDTKDIYAARKFCDDIRSHRMGTPLIYHACIHGLGHARTETASYATWKNPQEFVGPSLMFCEKITNNENDLGACAGGAFHALSLIYKTPEFEFIIDKNNPLKICLAQEKFEFQSACVKNFKTILFNTAGGGDFLKAISYIERIDNNALAKEAVYSLSYYAVIRLSNYMNDNELIAVCRSLQKRLHLSCIIGFVGGFMDFATPGNDYGRAMAFCQNQNNFFTFEERRACFTELGWQASKRYTLTKHREFCSLLSPEESFFCTEPLVAKGEVFLPELAETYAEAQTLFIEKFITFFRSLLF